MKTILEFEAPYGYVAIPTMKITGICCAAPGAHYPTFVATGADGGEDGGENGWYVKTSYEEAVIMLADALGAQT